VTIDTSTPSETSAPGITAAQASAFLRERLGPGVSDLVALRQGGWSNAYAFRHDGGDRVIRFSAYRDDFEKDAYAGRWSSPALPVPAVTDLGGALGGHYCISMRVPGLALDELDAPAFRATLPNLLAMLDALREADLTGTSGFGGWDAQGRASCASWAEYLLSVAGDHPGMRNHGWRDQLAASPAGIDRFDEARNRLAEMIQHLPPVRHLIHSDLLNYNVLIDPPRVSGVLDWGCGLYGDFLYDVAWFIHYWPWYPAWHGIDFAAEVQRHYQAIGLDVPDFAARILACRIHIGLGDQAYNTYMRRWDLVEKAAAETLALARGER
jgi:hygromycin-B 4-O-kinase